MKKVILIIFTILLFITIMGLFFIGKSRNFQFFGGIINRFYTTDKVVALTFDDGPQPLYTEKILNLLSIENVHATFFLTGFEITNHFDAAVKIVKAGHDIGNHTFSHKRMLFKSLSFIKKEIEMTDNLIKQTGYTGEITFRPPNGKKLFFLPYYLKKTNRKTITWNLEPDSIGSIADDSDAMVKYTLKNIEPGSIIIMHVMNKSREASIKAVTQIIQGLKNKGYLFLTMTELLDRYYKK